MTWTSYVIREFTKNCPVIRDPDLPFQTLTPLPCLSHKPHVLFFQVFSWPHVLHFAIPLPWTFHRLKHPKVRPKPYTQDSLRPHQKNRTNNVNKPCSGVEKAISWSRVIKAEQISNKRQTSQTRSRRHVSKLIQLNQLIENQQEHQSKKDISNREVLWQLHLGTGNLASNGSEKDWV